MGELFQENVERTMILDFPHYVKTKVQVKCSNLRSGVCPMQSIFKSSKINIPKVILDDAM